MAQNYKYDDNTIEELLAKKRKKRFQEGNLKGENLTYLRTELMNDLAFDRDRLNEEMNQNDKRDEILIRKLRENIAEIERQLPIVEEKIRQNQNKEEKYLEDLDREIKEKEWLET